MCLNDSQRTFIQTKGVVAGRILIGLLFFSSGLGMLLMQGVSGVSGYFASLGLPIPMVLAILVIVVKIGAGGALILGKYTEMASLLLIAFTVMTILIAHRSFEDINLFKNLAIIGGLLYVTAFGPGKCSTSS